MSRHRPVSRSLSLGTLVLFAAAGTAHGQTADVTLSTTVAEWNQPVIAHVEGVGCTEVVSGPTVGLFDAFAETQWYVTIGLACEAGSTVPYALDVPLPELHPNGYALSVVDTAATPPALLDVNTFSVFSEATLDVRLPAAATDDAPVTLTYVYPASSACVELAPPTIDGFVIRAYFQDDCPFLPAPAPGVYEQAHQVGPLPAGTYEVLFFDLTDLPTDTSPPLHRELLVVADADRCVPSSTALCLQEGRFRVEVEWRDFEGNEGVGQAVELAESEGSSGFFWFFSPENVELTAKVLDGCGLNGRHWVFLSSGTTVNTRVTVTDTVSGESKAYEQQLRESAPLVADTGSFACAEP